MVKERSQWGEPEARAFRRSSSGRRGRAALRPRQPPRRRSPSGKQAWAALWDPPQACLSPAAMPCGSDGQISGAEAKRESKTHRAVGSAEKANPRTVYPFARQLDRTHHPHRHPTSEQFHHRWLRIVRGYNNWYQSGTVPGPWAARIQQEQDRWRLSSCGELPQAIGVHR
uniref:Uncharacterized protein n=1 Tax=Ananas comosus var. bracteatus TaxID=296719 RepID=A0A6V7QT84_ANACO